MKNRDYLLEIAIFFCGAVVMVFELVGSRIFGPFFGTSIFVWTSLIGIILGSLGFGYYAGGKMSDKNPHQGILAFIIFLSAIFIGLTALIKDFVLVMLLNMLPDVRYSSIIASLILFMPASILLGMVSPYAAKLRIISLETSGTTIGNLYAISTAGSIIGTFLSGFYLIPHFGTNRILTIIITTLAIISFLLFGKSFLKAKIPIFILLIISVYALSKRPGLFDRNGLIDTDTAYNRVIIFEKKDQKSARIIRTLGINGENHSSMFLESNELVNEYTKYYHLARHFNPDFTSTLMFGGAGYSFPKDFLLKYPEGTMDVVEIDPGVTELAKKYFKLKDNLRLAIFHEDGRVYLNRNQKKYDVIFGDAFSSRYSLPYQLTTKEAVQKKFDALNEKGIVLLNIISAINGNKGLFLRAEYATYKEIFPQVFLFPVNNPHDGEEVQNIILLALKSRQKQNFTDSDSELNLFLTNVWKEEVANDMPIFTDDYAPVDYYMSKAL